MLLGPHPPKWTDVTGVTHRDAWAHRITYGARRRPDDRRKVDVDRHGGGDLWAHHRGRATPVQRWRGDVRPCTGGVVMCRCPRGGVATRATAGCGRRPAPAAPTRPRREPARV